MQIRRWIVLTVITSAIGAATPVAAKGCRQMHEAGDVLEPGCVEITRDIVGNGPPTIIISVGSDETVIIDLCGKKVSQPPTTTSSVIFIASGGRVVIKNGTLEGGSRGVESFSTNGDIVLDRLNINGSADAGILINGADDVTVRNSDVDNVAGTGMRVINSSSFTLESNTVNQARNGVESLDNILTIGRALSFNDIAEIALTATDSDHDNPWLRLFDVNVTDAATGIRVVGMQDFTLERLGLIEISGSGLEIVDSSGGSAERLQLSGVDGDSIILSNSSGNSIRHVRGVAGGRGLVADATSSGNFFESLQFWNMSLEGIVANGSDNWFDRIFSIGSGACPIQLGAGSTSNLVRQSRTDVPVGCTCGGVQTGGICNEGSENLIEEVLE